MLFVVFLGYIIWEIVDKYVSYKSTQIYKYSCNYNYNSSIPLNKYKSFYDDYYFGYAMNHEMNNNNMLYHVDFE